MLLSGEGIIPGRKVYETGYAIVDTVNGLRQASRKDARHCCARYGAAGSGHPRQGR